MHVSDPRIRSLLRQARQVAELNKRLAAEQLYRQILAEAPDTWEAWLELAPLLIDKTEQERAIAKALALQPDNEQAVKGMERLKMGLSLKEDPPIASINIEAISPALASAPMAAQPESVVATYTTLTPLTPITSTEAVVPAEPVACANHPNRQTSLRCNKCGKPICISCAKRTPVGYRCKSCIREQEEKFFNAEPVHMFIGILVAIPLSLIAAVVATLIGFWFFAIFIGATCGTLIGRGVFLAMGRRRARYMPMIVAGIIILCALIVLIFTFDLLAIGIYIALSASSAYYWLK